MRENIYNASVYMIKTKDFFNFADNCLKNPEVNISAKKNIRNYINTIHEYQGQKGVLINEFALDKTNPIISLLYINEKITKEKIRNALDYAILSESDLKEDIEQLFVEIYRKGTLNYNEIIENYKPEVIDFILKNGSFDYLKKSIDESDEMCYYISEDLTINRMLFAPKETNSNLSLLFTVNN